jgi:hypothetical protein
MAGNTDLTTAEYLIKVMYEDGLDEDALTSTNAALAYVEREYDFTSTTKEIATPISNGQGGYGTYADAYAARAGATGDRFVVPLRRLYHFGGLSQEAVRLSEAASRESWFADVLERDVNGATENFGQELNGRIYGRNRGDRALVHATTAISGTSLTLANPEDAAYFAKDMRVAALNGGTGALRGDATDFITVVSVNDVTGVIVADQNWSNIDSIALGDILIRWNMRNISLDGLAGWCPTTADESTDFLGVNQTLNRSSVAGVYVDVSSLPIRQAFLKAASVAELRLGKGFTKGAPIFVNPADANEFIMNLENVRTVDGNIETKYSAGIDSLQVLGCTLVKDRHCPVGHAYQIPKGAFTFGTAGQAPKIEQPDGRRLSFNRQTGQLEFTMALDGNLYSTMVNRLVHIKLPIRQAL